MFITAAIEAAYVDYFQLKGDEADKASWGHYVMSQRLLLLMLAVLTPGKRTTPHARFLYVWKGNDACRAGPCGGTPPPHILLLSV